MATNIIQSRYTTPQREIRIPFSQFSFSSYVTSKYIRDDAEPWFFVSFTPNPSFFTTNPHPPQKTISLSSCFLSDFGPNEIYSTKITRYSVQKRNVHLLTYFHKVTRPDEKEILFALATKNAANCNYRQENW